MDIRSIKFNIGKKKFTAIVLLCSFLLSLLMMYRYSYIQLKIKESKVNPFQSEDYLENLVKTNYYLYFKNISSQTKRYKTPDTVFLSEETIDSIIKNINFDYYSSRLDSATVKESFNYLFNNLNKFISNSNGNLKYMCQDTKDGFKIENYDFEEIKKADLKKIFRNYVVFEYDEEGHGNIVDSYGFSSSTLKNYYMDVNANEKIMSNYAFLRGEQSSSISNYKIEPIKNMKFIYAIPINVDANFYTSNDSISNYINKSEKITYSLVNTITKIIISLIAVITILIPTKKLKLFIGVERFSKFPIEITISIFVFLFNTLVKQDKPIKLVRETITGDFLKLVIDNGFNLSDARRIVNIINIGYWMLIFISVFIAISVVNIAYREGLKKYIKDNSILWKIGVSSYRYIYKKIKKASDLDFKRRWDRLYIYGILLLIFGLLDLGLLFELGEFIFLIIFIVYLIILLIYVKVVRESIVESNKDYDKLLFLIKDIADGNLDKDIQSENVGVYEDIKVQLDCIQKEYKKSVEEEIKSQKMKSELISNVSHDLKTPLTSILSYTDLLRSVETNEESKKYIETIYRKSERLKILIDDMFEISKAQTGNICLDMTDINIVQLAKQSIYEVEDKMNSRNITVKSNFPDKKIMLYLDGEKVYRVFENLLVNISKYGLENTRAYVNIKEYDDYVEIEFKNISKMEIDYDVEDIIERFRRGDKSRNTEGSGLGLSIAKSYIEAMDGEFKLELDDDVFKARVKFKK